jgi:aminodeoxyfutalosine synthase
MIHLPESLKLEAIEQKIEKAERITPEEGLALLRSDDLLSIGRMADKIRRRMHGATTWYVLNRHINHTNVCMHECMFCSFARKEGQEGAYTLSVDDYMNEAEGLEGIRELHTVGGCHPTLGMDYYVELLSRLKKKYPRLCCKFLTAIEIRDLAEIENLSIEETLRQLKEAGLGMLPGGGAEILAERARKKICRTKASGQEWLEVHRQAHQLGIPSNATMLYGHIETEEEIIDHLQKLRSLQDETGGFLCFVPLAYHPENNRLGKLGWTSGQRDLKMLALSRIYLDNFAHIKAYWIMLSLKLAQVALRFGADDFDGTVVREQIYHDAGATTPVHLTEEDLKSLIREAGLAPVERDAFYNPVGRVSVAG